ncbi:MAG: dihydrodipicolinate synthase family protein [Anaerolineaceae bacterium]|nr:dihydrodipicolinate synthase family protein [Anaerolineaceae bacterium]
MQKKLIRGVVCPMVTPFNDRGEIGKAQVVKLTEQLVAGGIRYLLPAGTTGEGMLLSLAERKFLTEMVIEAADGKAKVIPHTGCASTRDTVELTRHAKDSGAFAVSIIVPYFFTYSQSELLDHFSEVARQVQNFPLLLYSFPGNAKNPISTGLLETLIQRFPHYIGIKLSDINLVQFQEYVVAGGPSFNALCGVDALMLPALSVGSKGQVSGNSNVFPRVFCELYDSFMAGDLEKAQALQEKINVIRSILKDDITSFKAALTIKGINVGVPRSPIHQLTDKEYQQLAEDLAQL